MQERVSQEDEYCIRGRFKMDYSTTYSEAEEHGDASNLLETEHDEVEVEVLWKGTGNRTTYNTNTLTRRGRR
jgi:hypothetical protein